jgi:hypothetical protein
MKQKLFFTIALGFLLLVTGFNVQGQQQTAPLPPPDRESSVVPAPDMPARERAPVRRQAPPPAQTPPQRQEPAGTPAAQQTPAARQAPARQTPAAQQTPAAGIPDKGLFWGGMIGMGATLPEAYYANDTAYGDFAFGVDLFVGYDFGLFTGQVEFLFANESGNIDIWYTYGYRYYKYSGTLFQIPLIAKMDLHLGRFVLQPLVGLYLNFGLGDLDVEDNYGNSFSAEWKNPLLGWVAGGTLGFRLGRGFLFWDLRYMSNLGATEEEGNKLASRRAVLSSLGYQYYFKQK